MIRNCTLFDLDEVNLFLSELNSELTVNDIVNQLHEYVVYQQGEQIIGLIVYSIYCDRAELDYLYVVDEKRHQLIASELLDYLFNLVKNKCYNISLEVRVDNIAAINLYKKNGFECVKVIKNYYKNKDGFLMVKELD